VSLYTLARPLLFSLDPETSHHLTLRLSGLVGFAFPKVPSCPVRALGLEFPNPVGLAAGLDKNAEHIDALAALGFGFIEVGTVTPRPQPGNPKPRLFRLPQAQALVNRFGFNNVGVDAFMQNVSRARWRGILGINIGRNADTPTERAVDDYEICLEKVYSQASYVTLNISSPNTRGLRDLQEHEQLENLLTRLSSKRERLANRHGKRIALLLKVSPAARRRSRRTLGSADPRSRYRSIENVRR
jgi:dihydroorotate dehydrogenase